MTIYESEKSCITTFGMFLKLYKNSSSDKMHWSPGFQKADLVGLRNAPQKYLIIERDYQTGNTTQL